MAGSGSEQRWHPRPYVVAAHGGSGASLVARLLRATESLPDLLPAGAWAVITARTTGDGLDAVLATSAVLPPDTDLVAVVLSGDAPLGPPARLLAGLRLLPPELPVIWLPYVSAWRYGPASPASASRSWRAAARDLVAGFAASPEVTEPRTRSTQLLDHEGVPA